MERCKRVKGVFCLQGYCPFLKRRVPLKQLMKNNYCLLLGHGLWSAGFRGGGLSLCLGVLLCAAGKQPPSWPVNLRKLEVDRECVRDYCEHVNIFTFLIEVE